MILVKFQCDYADEFDVYGIRLFSRESWDNCVEEVRKSFEDEPGEKEVYFGTNEACTFSNFDEWFRAIEILELTDDETAMFKRLFPLGSFGNFLIP